MTGPGAGGAGPVEGARGAMAGGGRGGQASPIAQYLNQYELMVQQLNLSEEQKPRLKEKVDLMVTELQQYMQNAPDTGAAGRAGGAGGGAGPGGGGRAGRGGRGGPLSAQALKTREEVRQLANEHQVRINAELTLDQRYAWEIYKINRLLVPRLEPLALSEEQNGRVKAATDETVKALIALTDGKEMPILHGRLYQKVIGTVLTEEQAAQLMESPLPMAGFGRGGAGGFGGQQGDAAAPGGGFGQGPDTGQGGRGGRGAGGRGGRGGRGPGLP